jgi:hypothetical protein
MVVSVRVVVVMDLFGNKFHRFSYFAHGGEKFASRENYLTLD